MAIKVEKKLIANYGKGKNYTPGRTTKVKFVVVHYTGTLASAWNNLKYFASKYVGASAHWFIDPDGKIYQSVEEKDTAWSVGASKYKHSTARNSNTVSIEYVSNNREFTPAQIEAGAQLTREILKRYGLTDAAILRHYDVTGKTCPAWYINSARWAELLKKIRLAIEPTLKSTETHVKKSPGPALKPIELSKLLHRGMGNKKSPDPKVKQLQAALGLSSDGIFGANTERAVVSLQKKHGLHITKSIKGKKIKVYDGIVGKETATKALKWKWTKK